MVKKPILFVLLLGVASLLTAQQSWEGLATVSRFGRFPAGLYGASNLISPNSLVSVRNLETGVSERIIITDGVDEPGVFLVLSPEAAALLSVSGSGATRVRLTTIVSDSMPINTASEQPFHQDPDINPAAGVSAFPELAVSGETGLLLPVDEQVETEVVAESADPLVAEVVDEPIVEPIVEVADVPVDEPTDDPVDEPTDEPVDEPADDPIEEPSDPETEVTEVVEVPEVEPDSAPATGGQRGGIAAGIARTRVGQAQESFERPETPLEAERPGPADHSATVVGEPEVEPEETATAGIPALVPGADAVPDVAAQPEPPSDEEPPPVEEPETEPEITEPVETEQEDGPELESADPVEAAEVVPGINPIQDAVSAAVNRIPARDFFPAPVGEESDLGFAGLTRPADSSRIDVALAEADVPPVDRPELAGLAPLQALPSVLPASLAEAAVPPEDLPEFAAFGIPTAPADGIDSPSLPLAQAGEDERPVVEDLTRPSAPGVALSPGRLAQAAVAPQEIPDSGGMSMVSAPDEPMRAELVEAGVADVERPELADIGPADAPADPALAANLAEAAVAAEERPDFADLGTDPPPDRALDPTLAEAAVAGEERPELADVGPADAPADHAIETRLAEAELAPQERPDLADIGSEDPLAERPLDATLAEALVGDEDRPELADVGPADAPPDFGLDATLAEAAVAAEERPDLADIGSSDPLADRGIASTIAEAAIGDTERPDLTDVGPADAPGVLPLEAELVEALPGEEERPEDSLAAVEPSPEGSVPTLALEPEPAEEEIAIVEGSMESPEETPSDLLLTLEPADFRPPDVPDPDDESLIDRESPAEEPVFTATLEEPETVEEAEPVEVVEAVEPVEVVEVETEVEEIRPAETVEAVAAAPVETPAMAELPVVSTLVDDNYYLQIGAYTVPATAQVAVDALSATYPMAVMPINSRGTTVYRVLVGPLEQDETGTLLMWLRAKGYRDTFIRSGAEL